jgi:hypothetical protein
MKHLKTSQIVQHIRELIEDAATEDIDGEPCQVVVQSWSDATLNLAVEHVGNGTQYIEVVVYDNTERVSA